MDFPRNLVVPSHINSWSEFMSGPALRIISSLTNPSAFSWAVANTASFLPLYLPWPYNVKRVFWVNGSTVAGNSDIGIYSIGGGKIWSSGSTANSGASIPQYVTPSPDLLLPPGLYFMGYANDGTTNRTFGTLLSASNGRLIGCYQQATALPLPASATFAAYNGAGYPLLGITNTASGF